MASKIIQEGATGDEPMGAINVTSLVDVMFCLLIMFMVATPLMSPEVVDVDVPAGRGEELPEGEWFTRVITIDKDGKVFLGVLPLNDDNLADQIKGNAKYADGEKLFIQGDANVDYKRIVDVLVALKEAEVPSVGFIADPHKQRTRGSE